MLHYHRTSSIVLRWMLIATVLLAVVKAGGGETNLSTSGQPSNTRKSLRSSAMVEADRKSKNSANGEQQGTRKSQRVLPTADDGRIKRTTNRSTRELRSSSPVREAGISEAYVRLTISAKVYIARIQPFLRDDDFEMEFDVESGPILIPSRTFFFVQLANILQTPAIQVNKRDALTHAVITHLMWNGTEVKKLVHRVEDLKDITKMKLHIHIWVTLKEESSLWYLVYLSSRLALDHEVSCQYAIAEGAEVSGDMKILLEAALPWLERHLHFWDQDAVLIFGQGIALSIVRKESDGAVKLNKVITPALRRSVPDVVYALRLITFGGWHGVDDKNLMLCAGHADCIAFKASSLECLAYGGLTTFLICDLDCNLGEPDSVCLLNGESVVNSLFWR